MLSSVTVSGDRPSIVVKGEAWRICPECGVRLLPRRCPKCKTTSVPALLLEGGSVAEPAVGMTLGDQYKLLDQLGEGGMGKVFRAVQLSMDREVAVKVISREVSSDLDTIRRFQREAKVTSRLSHPHSIRVFDFNITDDGLLYLAMELLRGRELAVEIEEQGAMPVRRALDISIQILSALEEAHGLGIVHRDLKPTNIFLRDVPGEADFVKVMDFGIAKASFNEGYQRVTQAGTIVGTPKYMSPEQSLGRPTDLRSDIYALGIILHEMLTGSAPFEHESPVQVLLKHTMEPTPRLADFRPDVADLEPIQAQLDRLVAKEPAERPATAEEAVAELQALRDTLGPMPRRSSGDFVDAVTMQADVVPAVTPPAELPAGFESRSGDRATFVGVAVPVPVTSEEEPAEDDEAEERATMVFSTSRVLEKTAEPAEEPVALAAAEAVAAEELEAANDWTEAGKKARELKKKAKPSRPAVVLDPNRVRPIATSAESTQEPTPAETKTVVIGLPVEAFEMSSRETVALDVVQVNAATCSAVDGPAPKETRKGSSLWPFVVAALLLLSIIGGAVAYGTMGDSAPEVAPQAVADPAESDPAEAEPAAPEVAKPTAAPAPDAGAQPAVDVVSQAPSADASAEAPSSNNVGGTSAPDATASIKRAPTKRKRRKRRRKRRAKSKARSPYLMD